MTSTDQRIAVMLYLNLVQQFRTSPYTMVNMYSLYWENQVQIDSIVFNEPLLQQILQQFASDVENVKVTDKQDKWSP